MKTFLTLAAAVLFSTHSLLAAEGWGTDYKKAVSQAKSEKKLVLLDFTGSDWCGWCMKLDKEIFSTQAFKDYAGKNLVLVELDFPKSKSQEADVKKQNEELAAKYEVQGFPTIVVLDDKGNQVGQLGYMEGGPEAFIAELEKLKKS